MLNWFFLWLFLMQFQQCPFYAVPTISVKHDGLLGTLTLLTRYVLNALTTSGDLVTPTRIYQQKPIVCAQRFY